jgi:threonine dehydrogenase-like Zn-dependent dehydrogenase
MSKMQAAVLVDFNQVELKEIPIPRAVNINEVVVKIKSCGFCATDYKAIKGIRKNVTFPIIVGHEPSGIVHETGPGVEHFKIGDEVIVQPLGHCGLCKNCRMGNTHYCENAFVTGGDGPEDVWNGAFAQYMKTKQGSVFKKPPNISFDAAAITEPLAGAWKGVINYSQMQLSDDVIVIGVGGIGLLCMIVAKTAGAARLIAIDVSDYALENARKLGATHTINPNKQDAKKKVYEIIPDGPDLIIEAAGPIEAVKLMTSLRRRGTRWNVFGITTHEKFELDGGLTHFLEGRMDASFGTTTLSMTKAIQLMETGLVNTEKIISHRFALSQIHEAIEVMGTTEHNKVIVNP